MNTTPEKGINKWLPLLFGIVMAIGITIGYKLSADSSNQGNNTIEYKFNGNSQVNEVVQYINSKYVEEVDIKEIEENAIYNILNELDPHSSYIDAKQLVSVKEHMIGNFKGVGIEFIVLKDTIYILNVVKNGPSELAGIQAGDKIIEIADSLVAGVNISMDQIVNFLRGEKGTTVKVKIKRGSKEAFLPFTITRDNVPIHSMDAAYWATENTIYLKINRFNATTYNEFAESLDTLLEDRKKQTNLILDLRQNPGGYLSEAIKILNQIVEKREELLVYTKGEKQKAKEYRTNGPVFFNLKDVVILVDEGSASASEIVAGAVQDLDEGVVIGRRTYGKGLVQEEFPLSGNGALRLTVAKYYTPSNRLIQKPYSDSIDYENDLQLRYANGEFSSIDSISHTDSTTYLTKNGRTVFAQGGITPDVFIPEKTSYSNPLFMQANNQVSSFAYSIFPYQYADKKNLSIDTFIKEPLSKSVTKSFITFLKEKGDVNWVDLPSGVQQELLLILKSYIGRQLFGQYGAVKIRNSKDPAYAKALEIINSNQVKVITLNQ